MAILAEWKPNVEKDLRKVMEICLLSEYPFALIPRIFAPRSYQFAARASGLVESTENMTKNSGFTTA
jgi:hypothetical protein